MADKSPIEWVATIQPDGTKTAGATWNPIAAFRKDNDARGWNCNKVSPGCTNCYAARLNKSPRFGNGLEYDVRNNGKVEYRLMNLDQPMRWNRPRKIFVESMSDLFFEDYAERMIEQVFAAMALAPQHTFIVLTKRAARMQQLMSYEHFPHRITYAVHDILRAHGIDGRKRFPWLFGPGIHATVCIPWPLPNVWLGISVEDQQRANERIPLLLRAPATVRWISAEPLLGPVDLAHCAPFIMDGNESNPGVVHAFSGMSYHPLTILNTPPTQGGPEGIHWVVAGGESGPGARPMHPDWARSLRDQCQAAGVAFHFKQWGEWAPFTDNVDRYYRDGRPGPFDTNKAYVRAINKMIRHHGGSKLLDDRPEGWEPYMVKNGTCISGGSENQLFMLNVGKHAAGRLLDGRTWDEYPEPVTA